MTTRKAAASSEVRRGSLDQSTMDNSRALAANTGAWLSTMTECQQEMMAFVSMRLSKDGQTMRDIFTCKSPAEVVEIQSRWVQDTLKDYSEETSKMLAIYSKQTVHAAQNKG